VKTKIFISHFKNDFFQKNRIFRGINEIFLFSHFPLVWPFFQILKTKISFQILKNDIFFKNFHFPLVVWLNLKNKNENFHFNFFILNFS
jgi:hypothetical protein